MRQVLKQGCATAFARLEIDGGIIRPAILPTPREDADPCECQGAHRRLMGLALIPLRLIIDLRPQGMPRRFRCPLYERLAQDRRTREAPGPPGLLATACCDWRDPRVFLELVSRSEAFPLFAEGSNSRC
jgi:hypothetical protein